MAIIGMTGSGKSTLASRLLESRDYCVILRSKADEVRYPLTRRSSSASTLDDPRVDRLELHPHFDKQSAEFAQALDKVWRMGGFTVYVDETHYVDDELGLRPLLNRLLTQGRSPGKISMVCGMQRPTNVTRFAIGESSHVLAFGLEGRDVKILEQAASPRIGDIVEQLPQHHFAWYHIPSRQMWLLAA